MGTPPCPQGGSRPCRRGSREAELGPPTGIRAATLSSRPLQPARDRTSVARPRRRREHAALQPPQLSPAGSRRGFELGAPTGIRPADPNSPPTGIRAADPTSPPTAIRAADLNWPPTGTRAATLSSRPLQPARDRGSVAGPRKRRERALLRVTGGAALQASAQRKRGALRTLNAAAPRTSLLRPAPLREATND